MKNYKEKNVYEASIERLEYIFKEFDKVIVAFSGGKDSGVLLNITYNYAKEHNYLHKLQLFHIDHEAVYKMTRDYVLNTFDKLKDIDRAYFCLPLATQCGCKMDSDVWYPWLEVDKNKWVYDIPDRDYVYTEHNFNFDFNKNMPVYEFQMFYPTIFKNQKVITLTGIRATESFIRYMRAKTEIKKYKDKKFILEQVNGTYHGFPLYDWETKDVWVANAKFGFDYNKLYDLLYQARVGIEEMRVSSAFCYSGIHDIKMFKVIEPNTWGKLLSRINGVSFAGIYGKTTAMGWKSITKPKHLTWKEYCYFLLDTLPENTKNNYIEKLNTSIDFWKNKGGALSEKTVKQLNNYTNAINVGKISKISNKDVIKFEEYPDDIEEVSNFQEIPSYKRMCVCIMKNDLTCKYMGFASTKKEMEKRKKALEKYRGL